LPVLPGERLPTRAQALVVGDASPPGGLDLRDVLPEDAVGEGAHRTVLSRAGSSSSWTSASPAWWSWSSRPITASSLASIAARSARRPCLGGSAAARAAREARRR